MALIILLMVLFGLWSFFRWDIPFLYWEHQNVPFVARKFPYIFGNISHKKHRALQFADFYQNHRTHPIIGIYLFLTPSVLVIDLQLIRRILIENFQQFPNRGIFHNEKDDPLSAILGTLEDDKWKLCRSKLTPAFTSAKFRQMFPIIRNVGEKLVQELNEIVANDNPVEISEFFSRFTTEVICKCAFGIEDSTTINALQEMIKMAKQQHLKFPWNILTITNPDLAKSMGTRKHSKAVTDFFLEFVETMVQLRQDSGEKRNDYMQLLIDSNLTINEMAPLVYDLLSAGNVDSSSTLAFCLYELSLPQNRHIQDEARTEIRSVLGQHDELTYDVLKEMVYLEQIIKGNFFFSSPISNRL